MIEPKLWYLAHPVATDEKYTIGQNLSHAVAVARIAWDAGFRVILPWHTHCLFLDDSNPKHRRAGMDCDRQVLEAFGNIILVGHKLSRGMQIELDIVNDLIGGCVLNAVGVPDKQLFSFLQAEDSW